MGADATATVSPSATLPVSSTVDLPHLVGGGDSAKVRGGMPMPQAGAPAPAPMPEQRPQPPGPSTITKVGRGFSAAGQAASAASDLGLLDPAVGREVGGALGGAGRLIGAGEAFAAGRPLAGVRQALPALSQLVSPKPAATAEPTPVLPAATARPLSLASTLGAGGKLLGAGGTLAELLGVDPAVSGGLKAAGTLASAAPSIAKIPQGGKEAFTGTGALLEAAGASAQALGAEPEVGLGLTAAGRLATGAPTLLNAVKAPTAGSIAGGVGTLLGVAAPVAQALEAPPEVGFGLGAASTLATAPALIAGLGKATGTGLTGLLGAGSQALGWGSLLGLPASISNFIGAIDRADRERFENKQQNRILGSWDRSNQVNAIRLPPRLKAGDLSVVPDAERALEAAVYTSTRIMKHGGGGAQAASDKAARDLVAAFQSVGLEDRALKAVNRGTAWNNSNSYSQQIWRMFAQPPLPRPVGMSSPTWPELARGIRPQPVRALTQAERAAIAKVEAWRTGTLQAELTAKARALPFTYNGKTATLAELWPQYFPPKKTAVAA